MEERVPEPAAGGRVLVIDDDPVALTLMRAVLVRAGHQVHSRTSPLGATRLLASGKYDAVVVDLHMPEMQGDRLAEVLRRSERARHVPVVLVSGAAEAELHTIASAIPGTTVVPKERIISDLPAVVASLLRRGAGRPRAEAPEVPRASERVVKDAGNNDVLQAGRLRLTQAFLREVGVQLGVAERLWGRAARGDGDARGSLVRLLHLLRGEADMLQLGAHSRLLGALDQTLGLAPPGLRVAEGPVNAFAHALRVCADLKEGDVVRAETEGAQLRWLFQNADASGSSWPPPQDDSQG